MKEFVMADKIYRIKDKNYPNLAEGRFLFYCPGCQRPHPFDVPRWSWNGSCESPTFTPSLLCNQHDPKTRCHTNITDGKIQFHGDCWHELKGKLVDMVDWHDDLW